MKKIILGLTFFVFLQLAYSQTTKITLNQVKIVLEEEYDFFQFKNGWFDEVIITGKDSSAHLPVLHGIIETKNGYFIAPLRDYLRLLVSNDTVFYVMHGLKELGYYTVSGIHHVHEIGPDTLGILTNYKSVAKKD